MEGRRRERRRDGVGALNLVAVLAPGALFAIGLAIVAGRPGFEFLEHASELPAELFVVAACGTLATACGILDWRYHRAGRRRVPRAEQKVEAVALVGGGAPLFAVMSVASVSHRPWPLLVAAVVLAAATTVAIVHDERRFHGRCSRYETLLHRGLVLGNAAAWLAWWHWCATR
ncbi:MAG: hypothetical protein R3F34_17200 [Planctomycetota bacterium]